MVIFANLMNVNGKQDGLRSATRLAWLQIAGGSGGVVRENLHGVILPL
jgi:hypothetical protein